MKLETETHSWLHKGTSLMVWHLADIPLYNGRGFWTFPCLWGWLEMPIPALQSPFHGVKLVQETIYFEGWCTSKEMEKVLKVKLKFRESKSGRPTDDLLLSTGRPTAILGVRTPGRPLNLHADVHYFCTIALRTSRTVLTRAWALHRVDLRKRGFDFIF